MARKPDPHQTEELNFLRQFDAQNRFAVGIGHKMSATDQNALQRLQEREWIRLIDITPLPSKPGLFRIFLLTKPALDFMKKTVS